MGHKIITHLSNPTRAKIFYEISLATHSGQGLTAKDLLGKLPHISQPAMYRHIKVLLDDGILHVFKETPIRGVMEKSYQIAPTAALDLEAIVTSNDGPGYMALCSQFLANITGEFAAYTARPNIDIIGDLSSMTVAPMYATKEEIMEAMEKIGAIIMGLMANEKTPARASRNLYMILTPPKA